MQDQIFGTRIQKDLVTEYIGLLSIQSKGFMIKQIG